MPTRTYHRKTIDGNNVCCECKPAVCDSCTVCFGQMQAPLVPSAIPPGNPGLCAGVPCGPSTLYEIRNTGIGNNVQYSYNAFVSAMTNFFYYFDDDYDGFIAHLDSNYPSVLYATARLNYTNESYFCVPLGNTSQCVHSSTVVDTKRVAFGRGTIDCNTPVCYWYAQQDEPYGYVPIWGGQFQTARTIMDFNDYGGGWNLSTYEYEYGVVYYFDESSLPPEVTNDSGYYYDFYYDNSNFPGKRFILDGNYVYGATYDGDPVYGDPYIYPHFRTDLLVPSGGQGNCP